MQFDGFDVPDEALNITWPLWWSDTRSGASGTWYLLTLAISMRERGARYRELGVCAGSGQSVAVLLENAQM